MNLHLVLHLLKTDWQRLRWLILATWALMFLAAWPALSFDPGKFNVPMDAAIYSHQMPDSELQGALEKQGEILPLRNWVIITMNWLFTGSILFLVGCLGFHARMWTEGRPTRKRETVVAKAAGLLLFAILPVLVVLTVIPLLQGYSWDLAAGGAIDAGALLIPRLAGVMLLGALCGTWWSWLAGMFAVAFAFLVLPRLLQIGGGLNWWENPLRLGSMGWRGTLPLWIGVAVLSLLLALIPRYVSALRKIGSAIVLILFATHLMKFIPAPAPPMPDGLADLPDWSDEVKLVLQDQDLSGRISNGYASRGPDMNSITSADRPILNMVTSWKTEGLPKDAFASWMPEPNSRLIADGQEIATTILAERYRSSPAIWSASSARQKEAFNAIIAPGSNVLSWDGWSELGSGNRINETFTPIEPTRFSEAELEMEMQGVAYRLQKVADVPLGEPVRLQKDGVTIYIRRLDVDGFMPFVDMCLVMQVSKTTPAFLPTITPGWTPVIYFPEKGMARLPWSPHWTTMRLAPGIIASRALLHTEPSNPTRKKKPDAYGTARFMLLKRENLGTMTAKTRSPSLPLLVTQEGSRDWNDSEPPPITLRPDPATASAAAFEKWRSQSSMSFDDGWSSRDLADFVPQRLDRVLIRDRSVSPPAIAEGNAIILACPESRKSEVFAALPGRNKIPENNWLSDVILRRGWVQEAKPQILEMIAREGIGENPYSQLMVAMLEDPQTYPALLEQEAWFDIYAKLRQLPGIEPALTKAITTRYRAWKAAEEREDPRWRQHHLTVPAAHGIPEAFAELLENWSKMPTNDLRGMSESMRAVILLPGGANDWKTVVKELSTRGPGDFRYDPLARQWVPLATETP